MGSKGWFKVGDFRWTHSPKKTFFCEVLVFTNEILGVQGLDHSINGQTWKRPCFFRWDLFHQQLQGTIFLMVGLTGKCSERIYLGCYEHKDPYWTTSVMESKAWFFFVAHISWTHFRSVKVSSHKEPFLQPQGILHIETYPAIYSKHFCATPFRASCATGKLRTSEVRIRRSHTKGESITESVECHAQSRGVGLLFFVSPLVAGRLGWFGRWVPDPVEQVGSGYNPSESHIYFRPFMEVIVITPWITRPKAHLAWFGCGIFVLQKLWAQSERRFVEIESDGLVVEDVGISSHKPNNHVLRFIGHLGVHTWVPVITL